MMAAWTGRWIGPLLLYVLLLPPPATPGKQPISEVCSACGKNCQQDCPSVDPSDGRLSVQCGSMQVHWNTTAASRSSFHLGMMCDSDNFEYSEQRLLGSTFDPLDLSPGARGRRCVIYGCTLDSNSCSHFFTNVTCPGMVTSSELSPTTITPTEELTTTERAGPPVTGLSLSSVATSTGNSMMSGNASLLVDVLPAIVIFTAGLILLLGISSLVLIIRRTASRSQHSGVDYEEEFDDYFISTEMAPFRSYSVSSVLTVLDSLSYSKPSYPPSSSINYHCHHQTDKKYRLTQDLSLTPLPQSQHGADMEVTLPLSPTEGCLNGSCLSAHNPPLSCSLGGLEAVHSLSEDKQGGGDEGRIWSDLEMTCFSESDSENFDGDRDSKSYFTPENLESCGVVGMGSKGVDGCCGNNGSGVTVRTFSCLETCSRDICQLAGDGTSTGGRVAAGVSAEEENCSKVTGCCADDITDCNGVQMQCRPSDCDGIRHKPLDWELDSLKLDWKLDSDRCMNDNDSVNYHDPISNEGVKGEGSINPQVQEDPSSYFKLSSAKNDSGFASCHKTFV